MHSLALARTPTCLTSRSPPNPPAFPALLFFSARLTCPTIAGAARTLSPPINQIIFINYQLFISFAKIFKTPYKK